MSRHREGPQATKQSMRDFSMLRGGLDCFVALLLAMTIEWKDLY
jgi:hypothetical protein